MIGHSRFAGAAALALLCFIVTPAVAQDEARTQIHVRYGDLDLAKSADVDRLVRRVHAATRRVCSSGTGTRGVMNGFLQRQRCLRAAKAGTASQIALAAAHSRNQQLALAPTR